MESQAQLKELVERMQSAAGANLQSVAVYGSAAAAEFHAGFSDVNLMCVMRELSPAAMQAITPVIAWWTQKDFAAPLFFTRDELERAADVFPIEMLDIKHIHRVLHGADLFVGLEIPMVRHRIQLEHELRTKLLFLRQHYLTASPDPKKVLHLMVSAVSSFATLFRHTLITLGDAPTGKKGAVIERLAARLNFAAQPFLDVLQLHEGQIKPEAVDAQAVFAGFLQGIETTIEAVDRL